METYNYIHIFVLLSGLLVMSILSLGILICILIAFAKKLIFSLYLYLSACLLIPPLTAWVTVKALYFITRVGWPSHSHEIPPEILMQLQSSSAIIYKMMSWQIAVVGFVYLLLLVKKILVRWNNQGE